MIHAIMTVNWALVVAFLFALSEALSLVPSVRANGIFQAVYNCLKGLKEKTAPVQKSE